MATGGEGQRPDTPFRAITRSIPRLTWPERLGTLGGALLLSFLLFALVVVVWTWWVGWLRGRPDEPVPLWLAPYHGLDKDSADELP